ncbi:MAG: PadR family transcriptional regulator [Candidatus Thorarchaeota archaeon]|jgi:DNA-binding PadR family transcriptional regulator
MCDSRRHRHWGRRTSSVPKGFLRYQVLKLLNEKAMSGAELMREIEEKTNKHWKPSPGSIYPLLSWLLDSGYTQETPDSEAGVRRYVLTDEGKKLFEEHEQKREQYSGTRFFGPQYQWFDWSGDVPDEASELVESWQKMRQAGFGLLKKLKDDYSENLAKDAKKLVDEFAEKISSLSNAQKV